MSQFKYVIWKRIRWFFMICFFILVMIFYFSEKGEERIIPDINDASKIKSSEQTSVKKFTDSQGRFRIPDSRGSVFQNAMTLYAQAPGYMPGFCTITNMSPDIPPVFIKMRKGVRIHGTVYSSSHEPVSHAEWEIRNVNSKTQPTGHNRYTDARGRYDKVVTHNWIGEEVYVYVFSQKYGYGMVVLKIPEDGGDIERDITLCPGISVTAWVLDQYGEGIRGHEINARTSEMSGYVFSCFRRTDIEGSAVFDNLPKALFEFSIKDLRNDLTKEIILKETLDLSNVDSSREFIFSLDKPGDTLRVVSGSVTDDEGNPIKDVLVDSYALMKETKTDAEGQYRIEATSSEDMKEPRIEFSKTGYLRFRRYFKPDQVEDHLDVIMKKAFSTVFYGTIVTRNGEIPTEAEIEVWGSIHLLDFRRVSLGKGGTFEFRVDSRKYSGLDRVRLYSNDPSNMNMETGTYYYIKAKDYVHGSGCSQAIKSVGGDSVGPFEIILSWGMLKGYLRDGKTGDAVSNGLISSYELSSMHYDIYNMKKEGSGTYTYSDQSGYFEISPLPPGSSKIYFYHPDYWIQERIAPEIKQENLEVRFPGRKNYK
jgi:hypothetical protein